MVLDVDEELNIMHTRGGYPIMPRDIYAIEAMRLGNLDEGITFHTKKSPSLMLRVPGHRLPNGQDIIDALAETGHFIKINAIHHDKEDGDAPIHCLINPRFVVPNRPWTYTDRQGIRNVKYEFREPDSIKPAKVWLDMTEAEYNLIEGKIKEFQRAHGGGGAGPWSGGNRPQHSGNHRVAGRTNRGNSEEGLTSFGERLDVRHHHIEEESPWTKTVESRPRNGMDRSKD